MQNEELWEILCQMFASLYLMALAICGLKESWFLVWTLLFLLFAAIVVRSSSSEVDDEAVVVVDDSDDEEEEKR
ncbi:MAG TPA: hypothetical protein P5056_01915 [Candidatus Paceibacterota bacterium]|nr:hypothetical protein [Candidatus Paceibacterota bacterium]